MRLSLRVPSVACFMAVFLRLLRAGGAAADALTSWRAGAALASGATSRERGHDPVREWLVFQVLAAPPSGLPYGRSVDRRGQPDRGARVPLQPARAAEAGAGRAPF